MNGATRRRVFIVEDSVACAETLEVALDGVSGCEPHPVHGIKVALAMMRANASQVAAVVTDLNLSHASGLDLIREIRADALLSRIPIILISGDTDPHLSQTALAAGANAFFSKPYSPAAVRRTLEQLL